MWRREGLAAVAAWILVLAFSALAGAQELQPGDAFLTRFSGTTTVEDDAGEARTVINPEGPVAGVVDIAAPGGPPVGQHLAEVPRRLAVSAAEVGQVFGIAYDDASPPNIYLTATSAFGLHLNADGSDWMVGMWGEDGGPGTVWKLNAAQGYAPEVFARITLHGRENTGAALGNIAFDRWNRQLYVSDLETGMIHALSVDDGTELDRYDHGLDGRAQFTDALTGEQRALPLFAFDPSSEARVDDCPDGDFANTPACWNVADFRRRVWGLGVRRDAETGEVRLYYAVWSSQGLGSEGFEATGEDEKVNTVWSVRIAEGGVFDRGGVRREFALPEFFIEADDIVRAGISHPVADIAFPKTGDFGVMLVAERGGLRNLGLQARAPFAFPHESRVLHYELDEDGIWQAVGRYEVGYYDRKRLAPPYVRANAAGGVDLGYGYAGDDTLDEDQAAAFVWMTGDALCTPDGPCRDPESGEHEITSEVHGLQGTPAGALAPLLPEEAEQPYPATGTPYPPDGPDGSYMIDADEDGDSRRNDATKIGDVEIYEPYPPPELLAQAPEERGADWGVPPSAPEEDWWPGPPPGGADAGFEGPDLAVQKVIPAPCKAGAPCDFVILVTNTGTVPYTDPITIVDELANDWTLAGWGPAGSQWNCQQAGTELACTHPAPGLLPGDAGAVTVTLQVPAAQVAGEWENCAALDYGPGGGDADPSNDIGCDGLQFGPEAPEGGGFVEGPEDQRDLAIEKTLVGPDCEAGKPCPFTITITNTGLVKFDGQFRFTDTMPQGWSFSGTSAGWWCLLTAGGGPLFSCWRDLALEPGQAQSVTVTLVPPATAPAVQAQNCAAIDWSQTEQDVNPNNDGDACAPVTLKVAEAPAQQPEGGGMVVGPEGVGYDLAIDKGPPHAAQAAAPGAAALHVCAALQPCPFTVTITNQGIEKYEGPFSFTDTPKGGWSYAAASKGWSCSPADGAAFTCTGQISLDPGQSESVELKLDPMPGVPLDPVPGENCVEIDWSVAKKDQNAGNDGPVCMPVVLAASTPQPPAGAPGAGVPPAEAPDLHVRKEAVSPTCQQGKECWFNIIIRGTQDFPFKGKFKVTDIPPKGWTFAGGGKLGLWDCAFLGCVYDVAKYPNLPANGFTSSDVLATDIRFTVPANAKNGTYKNCVIVTFEPPPGGGISKPYKMVCANVQVANQPKLTIAKHFDTPTCSPGGECNFIVTIKNEGKGPYTGFLTLWDRSGATPAGLLKVESVSAPGWTCSTKFQTLEHFLCYGHSLAPGKTVIVTAKARLASDVQVPEIENCGNLHIYKSDPKKLSLDDKLLLVRHFLESKGYETDVSDTLGAADKKAISDFKTKNPIFSETSGEITDEFLNSLLPDVEDASGKNVLESCSKVRVLPNLATEKIGLTAAQLSSAAGKDCQLNHLCPYTIKVSATGNAPYTGPVKVREELPQGWVLHDYSPKGGNGWSCQGSNPVVCTYPSTTIPASGSIQLEIVIKPTAGWYQAVGTAGAQPTSETRHPWISNCSYVLINNQVINKPPYKACYRLRVTWLADIGTWDYDPTGTGSCLPPNCSFYQFTATRQDGPYSGPLNIQVTTPWGSDFPELEIVKAPATCSASNWSCTRAGSEFGGAFTCRISECAVQVGQQVAVRLEGNVAPDLTEPPPAELKKTACSILEWQRQSRPGSIEQQPGPARKEACFTTTILAQERPAAPPLTCGPNEVARGGRCVCKPLHARVRGVCKRITCQGGQIQRGSGRCICRGGFVSKRIDAATYRCVPPRCTRGTEWSSRHRRCVPVCRRPFVLNRAATACVCPPGRVRRGNTCVRPKAEPPKRVIKCIEGRRRGNRCICRRGWNLQRIDRWTYRCVPPRAPKVEPPKRVIQCIEGRRRGNRCICRRGWTLQRIDRWTYRCVPPRAPSPPQQPQVVPPKMKMIPGRIICPKGTRWVPRLKRCVRIIQ